MAKPKDILNWLKEMMGLEKPQTSHPRSIVERLEGLIPPVEKICEYYKVDKQIAEEIRKDMMVIEKRMRENLERQQQAIVAQELLIEQQDVTSAEIDVQVNKQLNAETIIQNFRIFLTEDELTIQWILEHIIKPGLFGAAFGNLEPERQRALFNSLRTTVNSLQKEHGMLVEPRQTGPGKAAMGGI